MYDKTKKLFLIKNEKNESIGVYFSLSKEKLIEYINSNKLFPKTKIKIEEFQYLDEDEEIIPLISSERFLWYDLKYHNIIHIVR